MPHISYLSSVFCSVVMTYKHVDDSCWTDWSVVNIIEVNILQISHFHTFLNEKTLKLVQNLGSYFKPLQFLLPFAYGVAKTD